MQTESEKLSERLLEFAASIIRLTLKFDKSQIARHIALQLVRSSTSSGANYQEACAAESKADFIHKMQLVLKELRESLYWLRLSEKSFPSMSNQLPREIREARELTKIFAKSVITAKSPRP